MGQHSQKTKILIVDDEQIVREVLMRLFKKNGFLPQVAQDGQEALEKAAREKPDIIILDLIMPKVDGIQVWSRLRKDNSTRRIPIIFLSAHGKTDEIIQAGRQGNNIAYIEKPFDAAYLFKQIDKLLTQQH